MPDCPRRDARSERANRELAAPTAQAAQGVMLLDAGGAVTYANLAAARRLGAPSPIAAIGGDAVRALSTAGAVGASLALDSALRSLRALDREAADYTLHDVAGRAESRWRVTRQGDGYAVSVQTFDAAPTPAAPPLDVPLFDDGPGDGAGVPAVEQLAHAAQTLLAGTGACVVVPAADDEWRVVGAAGTLHEATGGVMAMVEPSPLREAVARRQIVTRGAASPASLATIVAPVVDDDAVVAALCVVSGAPLDARDHEIAERLALHGRLVLCASVVEVPPAPERADDRAERSRAVADATTELARLALAAPPLTPGAAALLAALDRLVPSAGKALSVPRPGTTRATDCVAASGSLAALRGVCAPRSVPTDAPAEAHAALLAVDDLRQLVTPARCPDAARHPGVAASAVLLPLVARGRVVGDLTVTTPLGHPLGPLEREALLAVAESAALSLDAMQSAVERGRRLIDERQVTDQLRQAEKMAALGELVAGVAHEINNPLTGISAFAELLLEDPLTDDQRESVRLIKRESDRAIGVVRDLLAFSRTTEPTYVPLDLNELVERTLRLRAYALRLANVEVRLTLAPDLPAVLGDDAKLQQVVLNILVNAEHAMRDAATRRLDVATRVEGGRVVVALADSGRGIPAEVLPRVFDPFFTTKPAGEGTGLGLSVSYGILQSHGGELRATSEAGHGATFEIALPALPDDEPPTPFGDGRPRALVAVS